MDPYDRLANMAQALLDSSVMILNTVSPGAPNHQFLTAARPAIDCEFVAVQVSRLAEDSTSPLSGLETKKRNKFGNIILATYVIWVVRCGPAIGSGLPPTDAAKTDNTALVLRDGWVLWNGIRDIQDDLFDDCLGVYFDGGVPIDEQGGYVGWIFQIRASIEGYRP